MPWKNPISRTHSASFTKPWGLLAVRPVLPVLPVRPLTILQSHGLPFLAKIFSKNGQRLFPTSPQSHPASGRNPSRGCCGRPVFWAGKAGAGRQGPSPPDHKPLFEWAGARTPSHHTCSTASRHLIWATKLLASKCPSLDQIPPKPCSHCDLASSFCCRRLQLMASPRPQFLWPVSGAFNWTAQMLA